MSDKFNTNNKTRLEKVKKEKESRENTLKCQNILSRSMHE